jgi:two-component sensor histidine kinase
VTGVASATVDLTPIKQAEEALRTSLREKEVLLKEIHHRVKNNMQVISSLVDLQADQLQDASTKAVLQDLTHRVRSMALVHEKLYQSTDIARVDFADYAQSLLGYLWRAHGTAAANIRLTLELEQVPLSVNEAVPCGLILNELATNALKHAFKKTNTGEVIVSLSGSPAGNVRLRLRDNGTGLPPGFDWRQTKSLGLHLVKILARQLSATVDVSSIEGTEFSISFGGSS